MPSLGYTPPLSAEHQFLLTASKAAISICRTRPRTLYTTKADASPVCVADLLIQTRITRLLHAHFPGDTLLAEETLDDATLAALGEALPRGDGGGREWVLDPIDGTKGYLSGASYATGLCLPGTCASLALAEEGVVLLAGQRMDLVRVCDGVEMEESGGWLLSGGVVSIPELGRARKLCCGSLVKYAAVARGRADVFVQLLHGEEKAWDHAAGLFAVVSAGGCVSDETGGKVELRDGGLVVGGRAIVATRKGVRHEYMCEIVTRALG